MPVPSVTAPNPYPGIWPKKPRLLMLEVRHPKRLDAAPVACLLIERDESYVRASDGTVIAATIHLWYGVSSPYRLGQHQKLCFEGCYKRREYDGEQIGEQVSLTSDSIGRGALALGLEREALRGHRIGTYLMNEIVHWAKQWPAAQVYPIQLLAQQATDDNKDRRNRFYAQFGIPFVFDDDENRVGLSQRIMVSELTSVSSWEANIREVSIVDAIRDALETARVTSFALGELRGQYATCRQELQWSVALRRCIVRAVVLLMLAASLCWFLLRR